MKDKLLRGALANRGGAGGRTELTWYAGSSCALTTTDTRHEVGAECGYNKLAASNSQAVLQSQSLYCTLPLTLAALPRPRPLFCSSDIVAELHRVKDLRRGHTAKLRAAFTAAFNSGLLHHPADDTPPSAAAAAGCQPGSAASRTWRGMPVAGGPVEPQRVLEDASKRVMVRNGCGVWVSSRRSRVYGVCLWCFVQLSAWQLLPIPQTKPL